jgi:hypothetical protein
MAQVTVYMTDDLRDRAKAANINISQIVQNGLEMELHAMSIAEQATMITIDADGGERQVAFEGTLAYTDDRFGFEFYTTPKDNIVMVDPNEQRWYTFEDADDFASEFETKPEVIAPVFEALGLEYEYVEVLDI